MTYEEIRINLMQLYPNLTPGAIDDMTWEQIGSLMRGGKPYKGIPAESLEHAIEIQKDMKANWREYYGV